MEKKHKHNWQFVRFSQKRKTFCSWKGLFVCECGLVKWVDMEIEK